MAQIHHFDHGWITPTISYLLSVLGSLLGLTLAVRFRSARSNAERVWWLVLAAIAIGGTAIWSMHFVAMMGFSVVGTPIRYDVGLTAASAIIAMVAVAVGLVIALFGKSGQNLRIITGGIIAGLGVAAMHYTGMAAMHLNGEISYSTTRVGMSIGIAVVAASVALWLAVTVRKPLVIFASALVMGVAVNGMHFTGMSAMSVMEHDPAGALSGATATAMLVPIGLTVVFGLLGLAYALMAAPTEEDRAAAEYLAARRESGMSGMTGMIPRQSNGPANGSASGSMNGLGGGSGTGPASGSGNGLGGGSGNGFAPASGGQSATGAFPQQPEQPKRGASALGGGAWTYRDRSNSN
jgi:NO-binding membrane sensor protein with MHYT domain